jgi:hypothetical protein
VLFQVPNFVVFLCKGIQSLGAGQVNSAILLVCWPIIFIANYAFLQWWHRWIAARQMEKFDLVASESNPDSVFSTASGFLLAARHAFYHGHPYVLTWKPFAWAIQRWPRSSAIWIQFIRYLLIYPEAQPTLFHVYEQFAQSKCRYLTRESFLFCARRYLYSRDEHESKWLRRKFRRLSGRIDRAKRNVVSFWSSIINNTSTLTFKLSRVIAERFAAIDADFWDLTVHFPRNSSVCARYSAFLDGVLNDPKAAAAWHARADVLKRHRSEVTDILSMNAFAVFPLIPRSLTAHTARAGAARDEEGGSDEGPDQRRQRRGEGGFRAWAPQEEHWSRAVFAEGEQINTVSVGKGRQYEGVIHPPLRNQIAAEEDTPRAKEGRLHGALEPDADPLDCRTSGKQRLPPQDRDQQEDLQTPRGRRIR